MYNRTPFPQHSGWMADFGEYVPFDSRPTGGSAYELHNRFPEEWAQTNRDAVTLADQQPNEDFAVRLGGSCCWIVHYCRGLRLKCHTCRDLVTEMLIVKLALNDDSCMTWYSFDPLFSCYAFPPSSLSSPPFLLLFFLLLFFFSHSLFPSFSFPPFSSPFFPSPSRPPSFAALDT